MESKTQDAKRLKKVRQSIKDHLALPIHLNLTERRHEHVTQAKVANSIGLNVASIAYECILEGRSSQAFERQLYYDSLKGVPIGQLNHSDAFFYQFRSSLAAVARHAVCDYLSTNQLCIGSRKPPFAVNADKLTALRRTNQVVGILAIDYRSGCIVPIFCGSRKIALGEGDGDGVCTNMHDVLTSECALPASSLKTQVTGQAYDGAYFHCSVPQKLAQKIGHCDDRWTLPGWDDAHQLELVGNNVRADPAVAWYGNLANSISLVITKVKWGKGYELLAYHGEKLGQRVSNPGHVCETRFTSSERKIYKNYLANWRPTLKALRELLSKETATHERTILGNLIKLLLSMSNIVQMMIVIDVLRILKDISLFCQSVNALQWEKVERQVAGYKRIKDTLIPQLQAGRLHALDSGDFPYLSEHGPQIKAGKWQEESLMLIAVAQNDTAKAFNYALKNGVCFCERWCHHWNSRVISQIPEIWSSMAGCLDLRKLIRSPCPLSMAALRESFEEIMDWVTSCNVIDHLIPEREELFEQLTVLKRRLQALAKTPEFKQLWKTELEGAGTGTAIMKYLFTDKRLYSDVEDFVFLYNHMALKTANEAIIESMGCIVDLHASPQRHLKQLDYSNEALIHWNGPRPHEAKHFLAAALDMHFGTDKHGKQKPWHFTKSDRGARLFSVDRTSKHQHREWKVSKVVDRLSQQNSRLSFMTDERVES